MGESAMVNDDRGVEQRRRAAAAAGDARAMYELGNQLSQAGETEEAETWYRRAAEAGEVGAMVNLGSLLAMRGDLDSARKWHREAADRGDVPTVRYLGSEARQRGDLAEAEELLRRASDGGDMTAQWYLADLLEKQGRRDEAEAAYLRAAEAGETSAMFNLGNLLYGERDLDAGERWWRRAAELGHAKAMGSLGYALQGRGDLAGAEQWYRRGAEAGNEFSVERLAALARKRADGDARLDLVAFDTFDGKLVLNEESQRRWEVRPSWARRPRRREGAFSITERYCDFPFELETADPDELRSSLIEMQGLIESPTFDLGEHLPEHVRQYVCELPDQMSLLAVEAFELPPAQAVEIQLRATYGHHVHYSSAVMLLFARCHWVVGIETSEEGVLGEREAAVMRAVLQESEDSLAGGRVDPYDPRFDGLVALEQDPLVRMRLLAGRLRSSIRLDERLGELEPFGSH